MLYTGITFIVVASLIIGAYWFFVARHEEREQSALKRRLKREDPMLRRLRLLREPEAMSAIGPLNRLLVRYEDLVAPLKQMLDDSGVPLTLSVVVLLCAFTGFGVTLAINYYVGIWWVALLGGLGALYVPVWGVKFAKTRRVRQFEAQFPEAIDLIARALRAGHALATGIQMVAEEMPKPAGPEFRLLYDRQNYGAQLPDALKSFAARIPSLDARFFVTAVLTQREAGGNLSEVLDRLASVMRDRFRVKREVRVRSAHGRITATVLASMPPALAALMFMNDPEQFRMMTTDPLGVRMLIGGGVLEILGILVIRKLIDIEY